MNEPCRETALVLASPYGGGQASAIGLALITLALLSLPTADASAFDLVESFGEPAEEGGGGGRYFTGSPRDGFTCAVCHVSDEPVEAAVFSNETLTLFEDGYVPGQTYDIELQLVMRDLPAELAMLENPPPPPTSAGVIEITDGAGNPAGTLTVPDADASVCGLDAMGMMQLPVQLPPEAEIEGRQVAVSDSCGETRVLVRWTAPETPTNGIVLYAAAVSGDGDSLSIPEPGSVFVEGDYVQVAAIQLPVAGDSPESMRVGTACGVARGRSGRGWPLLLLVSAACVWRRTRR